MNELINRCRVLHDLAELRNVVAGTGGPVAVVHDTAVRGNPGLAFLHRLLREEGARTAVVDIAPAGTLEDAQHVAERLRGAAAVVAVGGGALLDTVKLGAALLDPVAARIAAAPQRSGWVLGPDRTRPAPLVAVPTTIGTAAEVSGVASYVRGAVKCAYTSVALQPDVAVLDARATHGMPPEVAVEGCLEIVLRCVGPVVGSAGEPTGRDRRVLRLAAAAAAELPHVRAPGGPDGACRARLARLSAATQRSEHLRGRAPFTVKPWFVANNLAHRLGCRKMQALANLIPGWWSSLPARPGLGSAARARQVWQALRPRLPGRLPDEPGAGFARWLDRLGVPPLRPLSEADVESVARSCVRMWGGGLPMLAGVAPGDVRTVLRAVRQTPAASVSSRAHPRVNHSTILRHPERRSL